MVTVQISDGLQEVVKVVAQEASSRVKRSLKTLSPTYLEQDLQQRSRFRRPILVGTMRVVQAMGMWNATKQRGGRERSPEQEYLIVNLRMERRKRRPYIGRGKPAGEVPRSGRGLHAVQRTWTLVGKESISPLRIFQGLFLQRQKVLLTCNTSRMSVPFRSAPPARLDSTRHVTSCHVTPTATATAMARLAEANERTCVWLAILLFQLHKWCTFCIPLRSSKSLLKYPYGIIHFYSPYH
jgi:hypothetical protein